MLPRLGSSRWGGHMNAPRAAEGADDDWGEAAATRECALLRPSTPPPRQPPDASAMPRSRITSDDLASLYPSTSRPYALVRPRLQARGASSSLAPSGGTKLYSLQALCLGVVGQHLEQHVEQLGAEGLGWLPTDMKAVLIGVARRRRILHDHVLLALCDEGFTSLDLWGCGGMLSDKAMRQALCSMTQLQALDITGCINISAKTLRKVAAACPHLKLLRLGVPQVEQAAARAMPYILPRLDAVSEEHVEEHWEALVDVAAAHNGEAGSRSTATASSCLQPSSSCSSSCSSSSGSDSSCSCMHAPGSPPLDPPLPSPAAAAAFGHGRLVSLRWLIWPNAPQEVQSLLALQCPKVQLNPMPAALSAVVARTAATSALRHQQQQQPQQQPQQQQQQLRWRQQSPLPQPSGAEAPSIGSAQPAAGGGCRSTGPEVAAAAAAGLLPPPPPGSWDPLDPMCALDQPLVDRVGPAAWEGLHSGSDSATPQAHSCRDIAERIRQAYVQREQRLRSVEQRFRKEQREAEAQRRLQLRTRNAAGWGLLSQSRGLWD